MDSEEKQNIARRDLSLGLKQRIITSNSSGHFSTKNYCWTYAERPSASARQDPAGNG